MGFHRYVPFRVSNTLLKTLWEYPLNLVDNEVLPR